MTPTQAKIHIERMMYRSSVAMAGESAASYALVKLIPVGKEAMLPLHLNLALGVEDSEGNLSHDPVEDAVPFPLVDFRLESGVVMPRANVAYATFGTLNAAKDNAVLVASYYGADYHGYDFLIGSGKALDPARHFIVATEMFGNGFSSSPSNTAAPMAGPDFPAIAIRDNVEASRRVLEHLARQIGGDE